VPARAVPWVPMADIGQPEREIEVQPVEAPVPRELPVEAPEPAPCVPSPQPDPLPA
jgi:hypothetical protein